ncbi:MAG: peptide/nickel transport system permease protein [Rhodospirillaceae bacterium]|jgi:peptide/nickel transport system permease protein|nr:peptide/nickel transport system permease protein [Rhodospirillaceae bacterium]MEA2852743.1 peptide/nickel transport system permease protein [Rhodospirillaceae bacterium]HEV7543241.1 ABC transporter permease [Reyranella sp.]
MRLAAFLLRRLVGLLGVLLGMSVLIFGIIHILPGNVAYSILGEFATPAAVAQLEAKLGLNDPLPVQYWRWLSAMLHGDLGMSIVMNRPAASLIGEALGRSALLAGLAFGLIAAGGISLGLYAATHRGRASDKVLTLAQFVLIAVPEFFWAILAVLVFASWLNLLPATGYAPFHAGVADWAAHLVLPVLVLSFGLVAHVSRLTRSSMLEVLDSRFVLAARARGLPERRVLWRHALPNALLPAITVLAIDAGLLIGGIVVVETVFAYPGLGRLLVYAIERHDLPLLQVGMMVVTAIYALANFVAELLYAALNPRIRVAGAAA